MKTQEENNLNSPIKIRPVKIKDLEDILEIENEAYPKSRYSRETFIYYLKHIPDGFVAINYNEGIAGYIIFESGGHLISIAIRKRFRRMGLGRKLIDYALQETRGKMWLEVRISNKGAIKFYQKLGMDVIGKIPAYYGKEDAIIMGINKKNGSQK